MIDASGSDYFATNNIGSTQFDDDAIDNETFIEMEDNMSFGYQSTSNRSVTPGGYSELIDYQISDWRELLNSQNTSEDEFDGEVLDVDLCSGLLFNVRAGNSRMRCLSTSSLTGPCIPPDLIMESRDSEDFMSDSFRELEDVQQQIYLEDIHRNLETDDLLAPLDECVDGAALQKELIDKLTGHENPISLAFDNNVGDTEGSYPSSLPINEEVKMVNATPGSENVSIDGMDVALPAGSIVLAVVNESGSLVPYSIDQQAFHDETASKHSSEVNYPLPTMASLCEDKSLPTELVGNSLVSSPTELMNPIENSPLWQNGNGSGLKNNLVSVAEAAHAIKKKLNFEMNNENAEEMVDIETVSLTTPVLEASDLATLLYEFEATESVNRSINESEQHVDVLSDYPKVNIEKTSSTLHSAADVHSWHPLLAKALEKVTDCSSNQTRSSITITSTRPSVGGSSSTTTTSISIKVKKVDGSKPTKSLIERKNELIKKKLVAHQRIKDALPLEIIEKIRASGTRKTTQILTEALLPKFMKRKKFKISKTKLSKRKKTEENEILKTEVLQSKGTIVATSVGSVFQEHDYCINYSQKTPSHVQSDDRESEFCVDKFSVIPPVYIKKEIKLEPDVFNKIPNYYLPPDVFIKEEKDVFNLDTCNEVEVIESHDEIDQLDVSNHQKNEDSAILYNRLPDYVTDISNIKPKSENLDSEQNVYENQPSAKPKKKLKLSEYRMRIRSTENSRSSSPSVGGEKPVQRNLSTSEVSISAVPNVLVPIARTTPLGVVTIDDSPFGEDNVFPAYTSHFGVVPADDDCHFLQEKQNTTVSTSSSTREIQSKNIPKNTKVPEIIKTTALNDKICKSQRVSVSNSNPNLVHKQRLSSKIKNSPKKTVIEIDLEEGELQDNDREERKEAANKLALLSLLPLSKMPPTSLGHSLLYSKKVKTIQAVEDRNIQKMQKVPSSSISNSSIASSSSSVSSSRYNERNRRHDDGYLSSSRSRSRSCSKKRSYRSQSPRGCSRLSSHRKSQRRWTKSHSKSSRRRSRSYSSVSVSSYSSRSRSRSYSKSYTSRSRSRSKSSRRKVRHSRRHRRESHSGDRYHSKSRSRSRCYDDRKRSSRDYRDRTSERSYSSSKQPHMYTRHMSKYRSLAEVERDVEERKVVYCGCIEEGTTRAELKKRFEQFGPIIDSNIHFRENGDNYGFVTFLYSESAFQALEHGNDDPLLPKYNLCFGGRRKFCREQYSDLDAQKDEYDYYNSTAAMDYDTLLQTALNRRR